jgi:hypothetical protein
MPNVLGLLCRHVDGTVVLHNLTSSRSDGFFHRVMVIEVSNEIGPHSGERSSTSRPLKEVRIGTAIRSPPR